MDEFYEKIEEILKTHTHLQSGDWKYICHVMFLKYRSAIQDVELYKKLSEISKDLLFKS